MSVRIASYRRSEACRQKKGQGTLHFSWDEGCIDLRNGHAGVREIVGTGILDVFLFLSLFGPRKMLNVAGFRDCIVVRQVGQLIDIRVGHLTMVTLVVVVGEGLPIVLALHAPDVVEAVLGKVESLESFLGVSSFEIILPFHFGRR